MKTPEENIDRHGGEGGRHARAGRCRFSRARETPGHWWAAFSPLWIPTEKKLVAGDTLFRDSIGRHRSAGEVDGRADSAVHRNRLIIACPEDAVVIAGHGVNRPPMGREKARNPFLRAHLDFLLVHYFGFGTVDRFFDHVVELFLNFFGRLDTRVLDENDRPAQ